MQEYVFVLDKKHLDSLGSIRGMPELMVAADEKQIWIRGLNDTGVTSKGVRQLPLQRSYSIDENNLLFLPGGLTPVAGLPVLNWLPIAEFVPVTVPVAALPGQLKAPAMIRLIPSTKERESSALLTTLDLWKVYAESAPGIRLLPLQFAVSKKSEVLVVGIPLPSIPGKTYWKQHDILIPAGYEFEVPMAASFISEKLNPEQDGLLIFDIDGTCEKVDFAFLVAARRSAVRLTTVTV